MKVVDRIELVAPGLVHIAVTPEAGVGSRRLRNLWTLGQIRKPHKCWECERRQQPGDGQGGMYRPVTNGAYRRRRICKACVHEAIYAPYGKERE